MLNRSRFHVQVLSTAAAVAVLAIPAVPAAQDQEQSCHRSTI
jgi:hypothetical protein